MGYLVVIRLHMYLLYYLLGPSVFLLCFATVQLIFAVHFSTLLRFVILGIIITHCNISFQRYLNMLENNFISPEETGLKKAHLTRIVNTEVTDIIRPIEIIES